MLPFLAISIVLVAGSKLESTLSRSQRGVAYSQRTPEVQGELGVDPEIVLHIEEVLALAVVADQVVGELNLAGQAEHEIGQVVAGRVGGDGAVRRPGPVARRSAC